MPKVYRYLPLKTVIVQLCQLLDYGLRVFIAAVPDLGLICFAMKNSICFALLALGLVLQSCDDTGYDHYYTEYLVTSNGAFVIEYLDKDEKWQVETVSGGFYYEFTRDPYQPLEIEITGLATNQTITAKIRAERKRIAEKVLTDDFPIIRLEVTDYPNY